MKTNNERRKNIIGIIGENASGKTTMTDYLVKKYNAATVRFSDMLADVLDRLYLKKTRANLQILSTILRQNFSEDIMSHVVIQDIKKKNHSLIVAEGIRRPSDTVYLRTFENFYLLYIAAEEQTRFERLKNRAEKTDDAQKTWEDFQKEGKQESEQKIKEIAQQANFIIDNNGTREEFYTHIDAVMSKLSLHTLPDEKK